MSIPRYPTNDRGLSPRSLRIDLAGDEAFLDEVCPRDVSWVLSLCGDKCVQSCHALLIEGSKDVVDDAIGDNKTDVIMLVVLTHLHGVRMRKSIDMLQDFAEVSWSK